MMIPMRLLAMRVLSAVRQLGLIVRQAGSGGKIRQTLLVIVPAV
jgi:hypothetical protein